MRCSAGGQVGLFHLSVPWKFLGSQPIRVTLEDIYVLARYSPPLAQPFLAYGIVCLISSDHAAKRISQHGPVPKSGNELHV